MPWVPTGNRAGKRALAPFKLATLMLYGIVPGVKRMGKGVIVVTYSDIGHYARMTHTNVRHNLQLLKDWGVVKDLELNRGYCVVTFNNPRLWDDNV